jgi:uridine kinase
MDSYYHDFSGVAETDIEVDVPEALDQPLLVAHVRALAEGTAIEKPVYDYATHSRKQQGERVEPGEYVVLEGLFALYWPEVRDLLELMVFVDIDHETALERRVERDVRERARTEATVREVYADKVRPNFDRFVYPTKEFAHVVVDGAQRVGVSAAAVLERLSGIG